MSDGLPQMLYHYTTARGALGIAESKTLWATSVRYLNDATEYLHALHLVRRAFEASEPRLSNVERAALTYFLDGLRGMANDWRGVHHYVVSLSSRPDLLSQWRAYAPRGGYCIGFAPTYLEKIASTNAFTLRRCIYDEREQTRLAQGVLNDALNSLREQPIDIDFSRLPYSRVANEREAGELQKLVVLQGRFEASLEQIATVCKNPAFTEESEWRLVASGGSRRIRFREGRTVIIPYADFYLHLRKDTPDARVQVICGPSADLALSQYSALQMFSAHDWPPTTVQRSLVPYREW